MASGIDDVKQSGGPMDRLTRIGAQVLEKISENPEYGSDVKMVIMLDDDDRGGIIMHGYEDSLTGILNVFGHIQAVFRANGMDLRIITPDQLSGGANLWPTTHRYLETYLPVKPDGRWKPTVMTGMPFTCSSRFTGTGRRSASR